MVKAKADTVAEYLVSQPFFNACGIYYGDGFDHFLKQMGTDFPDLDLSQIIVDDTIPLKSRRDSTVSEEAGDSIHTNEQGAKDADVETVI